MGVERERPEPGGVLHVLDTLAIGGKERAALRLARRSIAEGEQAAILLFDAPHGDTDGEYECDDIPCLFERRAPGLDLTLGYRIGRAAHSVGVGVIHAHNETALFYTALSRYLWPQSRCRIVATMHTRPRPMGPIGLSIWRRIARRVDEIVCVSNELAGRLRAEGWVDRCTVVPGSVDLAVFRPPPSAADDEFRIVTVGRLAPIKRQQDLILALRILDADGLRVPCDIVGAGSEEGVLREMGAGNPLIRMLGPVRDVAPVLERAKIFVLCSEHEGTPLAMLEAMAMGLPIIATTAGGIPAVLTDGVEGLLVPIGRPKELADAIRHLYASPVLRQRMGAHARQRAKAYSFEFEWRRYKQIYAGCERSPGAMAAPDPRG